MSFHNKNNLHFEYESLILSSQTADETYRFGDGQQEIVLLRDPRDCLPRFTNPGLLVENHNLKLSEAASSVEINI